MFFFIIVVIYLFKNLTSALLFNTTTPVDKVSKIDCNPSSILNPPNTLIKFLCLLLLNVTIEV